MAAAAHLDVLDAVRLLDLGLGVVEAVRVGQVDDEAESHAAVRATHRLDEHAHAKAALDGHTRVKLAAQWHLEGQKLVDERVRLARTIEPARRQRERVMRPLRRRRKRRHCATTCLQFNTIRLLRPRWMLLFWSVCLLLLFDR